MNDLERRLLQRQHSGWFETFLVAVILLNCVERMTWAFQRWESEADHANPHAHTARSWPLDRRPAFYVRQADNFAHMLHLLLKMRGVPPKVRLAPDGTGLLTLALDPPAPGDASPDPATARAARWFDSIHVTRTSLRFPLSSLPFSLPTFPTGFFTFFKVRSR